MGLLVHPNYPNSAAPAVVPNSSAAYTLAAWIRIESPQPEWYFSLTYDGNNGDSIEFNSGEPRLDIWSAGSNTVSAYVSVPIGEWHHYAIVRESATLIHLYIDGVFNATVNRNVASRPAATALGLGYWPAGSPYTPCAFAGLKMWGAALSASEVAAEKDTADAQRTDDLMGCWPILTPDQVDMLDDMSGLGDPLVKYYDLPSVPVVSPLDTAWSIPFVVIIYPDTETVTLEAQSYFFQAAAFDPYGYPASYTWILDAVTVEMPIDLTVGEHTLVAHCDLGEGNTGEDACYLTILGPPVSAQGGMFGPNSLPPLNYVTAY